MADSKLPQNLFDRCITAGVLILVILAGALAMSPSVADPDLWGHVQFGRDVIDSGQIEETTSYSFTASGFRWINHENLSEIVMAWVVDRWGNQGLLIGKFLLSLLVIGSVVAFNLSAQGWPGADFNSCIAGSLEPRVSLEFPATGFQFHLVHIDDPGASVLFFRLA